MKKRSSHVALCIVGAAAFALSGCKEDEMEARAFADLQSCKAQAGADTTAVAECVTAFEAAKAIHVESAPRYDSIEVCESEHGQGACGTEAQATGDAPAATTQPTGGGSSIFMPLLAGYLIGKAMGGGLGGQAAAQPLYKSSKGGFTNATGSSTYSSNTGRTTLGAQHFTKPPATIGQAPMTKATVAAKGGFGSSGSSRGVSTGG